MNYDISFYYAGPNSLYWVIIRPLGTCMLTQCVQGSGRRLSGGVLREISLQRAYQFHAVINMAAACFRN